MCHLNMVSLGLCGYQVSQGEESQGDSRHSNSSSESALYQGHTYEWYEVVVGSVLSTIISIAESVLNKIIACCGIKEDPWYIQPKESSLSNPGHEIDEVSRGM